MSLGFDLRISMSGSDDKFIGFMHSGSHNWKNQGIKFNGDEDFKLSGCSNIESNISDKDWEEMCKKAKPISEHVNSYPSGQCTCKCRVSQGEHCRECIGLPFKIRMDGVPPAYPRPI